MVIIYCLAYRSLLLLGLVPGSHSKSKFIFVEQGGFIAVTILQLAASYVLYLALHHESQFRSSGTYMYVHVRVYSPSFPIYYVLEVSGETLPSSQGPVLGFSMRHTATLKC